MWVFVYGSLMWDGWERQYGAIRSVRASLPGFRRDFNKASKQNWGSEGDPCPTLGLRAEAAAKCEGIAFELPDAAGDRVFETLKSREGRSFALEDKEVQLLSGAWVIALVPVNNPSARTYIGDRPVAERARMAKTARGSSGKCADYVKGIRDKLQELGIQDPVVEEFWSAFSEE